MCKEITLEFLLVSSLMTGIVRSKVTESLPHTPNVLTMLMLQYCEDPHAPELKEFLENRDKKWWKIVYPIQTRTTQDPSKRGHPLIKICTMEEEMQTLSMTNRKTSIITESLVFYVDKNGTITHFVRKVKTSSVDNWLVVV